MLQLLQINLFTRCQVLTHFSKLKQCRVNQIADEYASTVYIFDTVLSPHNGGDPDKRNMSTFQTTPR